MSELRNVVYEAVVASPAPQVVFETFFPELLTSVPPKRAFCQGAKKSLEIPGKHTTNKRGGLSVCAGKHP